MIKRRGIILVLFICQVFNISCENDVLRDETSSKGNGPHETQYAHEIVIKDLKIVKFLENSLTITWNDDGQGVIKNWTHLVEWFVNNNELVGNVSGIFANLTYTIENLDACTTYKIIVSVKDKGISDETNGTTLKAQIGAPEIVQLQPSLAYGQPSLIISWKAPILAGACIRHYNLTLRSTENEQDVHNSILRDTHFEATNLHACKSYEVSIKPIGLDYNSGIMVTVQSRPTLPIKSPSPTLDSSTSYPIVATRDSIRLRWNVRFTENNCTVDRIYTRCSAYSTEGRGFEMIPYGESNDTISNGGNTSFVIASIKNVSSFTSYSCYARICNEVGYGNANIDIRVTTLEAVPSSPKNFRLMNDEGHIIFAWESPKYIPGIIREYELMLIHEPLYPVPDDCMTNDQVYKFNSSVNMFIYDFAKGFSKYTARLRARTTKYLFSQYTPTITFRNWQEKEPGPVTQVNLQYKVAWKHFHVYEAEISWKLPCSLEGRLMYFQIHVEGARKNYENHKFNKTFYPNSDFSKNDWFKTNLGVLKAEYNYDVTICTITNETKTMQGCITKKTVCPAGIPALPSDEYLDVITLDHNIDRTTTSFTILLPMFPADNGTIEHYAIIVSQKHYSFNPSRGIFKNLPILMSWKESREYDFKIPYQITEPYWSPKPCQIFNYGAIKAVKITIGADKDCEIFVTLNGSVYCNGPLKSNTWYEVTMRAFTKHGYADSHAFIAKTSSGLNAYLITSLVLGLLILGIVAAAVIYKTHLMQRSGQQSYEINY